MELIPQISIYFDEIDKNKTIDLIQSGKLEKIKSELAEVFGDDFEIILNDIIFGSLYLKFCIFLKKYKNILKGTVIKKISKIKIIKDCLNIIAKKSFQYIEKLKPMSVIFINQDSVENQNINEKKIKEFLYENKHYNFSSETRNTNINESENLNEEKIEKIFGKIKEFGINEENELKKKIKNLENNEIINQKLQSYLEKAFKESIFEFKIIGLVIIDNEEQKKYMKMKKINVQIVKQKFYFIQQK